MPKEKWTGYRRFCPLARSLDMVGERWTLVIVQELLKGARRYTDLERRLPGIGTSVLADRLRKLEARGLVVRRSPGVGEAVGYEPTEAAIALGPILEQLRGWGVDYLVGAGGRDEAVDGEPFDVTWVEGVEDVRAETYEWWIDDDVRTLSFRDGELSVAAGQASRRPRPAVVLKTTRAFMKTWAAGTATWDSGRRSGEVSVRGSDAAWRRMLAATGYVARYQPSRAAQV